MILYVDETENDNYFILVGLLFDSEDAAKDVYYTFKKKASNYKLKNELKSKLFMEFKSTLMDTKFPNLKKKMLEEVRKTGSFVLYSIYLKKEKKIENNLKLELYTRMLTKIIKSIGQDANIVFDKCSDTKKDEYITKKVLKLKNVISVESRDSQTTPGLQLVDNMCSVIRRKYSNTDLENFYEIIIDIVIECKNY